MRWRFGRQVAERAQSALKSCLLLVKSSNRVTCTYAYTFLLVVEVRIRVSGEAPAEILGGMRVDHPQPLPSHDHDEHIQSSPCSGTNKLSLHNIGKEYRRVIIANA